MPMQQQRTAVALLAMLVGAFWFKTFTSVAIFTLAATGIGLLYGRLGLVSLSQVALVGVGSWVALRLNHGLGLPFEINILAGGIMAALIGMIIGLPALRMRGLYLALVTLMAAAGFQIFASWSQFPNGNVGFWGRTVSGDGFQSMGRPLLAQSDVNYFRYVVVIAVIGFLLVELHARTRPGRAWAMIRKSEASAMSVGVNVTLYKTWAFTFAGFLAGISGGLLAGSIGRLEPATFPAMDSIMLFALTVVGGAFSWGGIVIAGLLFRGVPALLNDLGLNGNISLVIFGVALIHGLITAPQGIAGQLGGLVNGLLVRRK